MTAAAPTTVPDEGVGEHLRNALAVLVPHLELGGLEAQLAADLNAVRARLERGLVALNGCAAPGPSATPAATGHPVRATVELTWAASCAWLADVWRAGRSPTVTELVAHWQTCGRCHADAARATARVTRRAWVP